MKYDNFIQPKFSFFKAPVTNTQPHKNITLADVFKYITGQYCKPQTLMLRSISDKNQNRKCKASKFPYVTFSGIFETRIEKSLTKHSGLIAIDFDHLKAIEEAKLQLLKDPYFETELLFVSPNGNGLKWVIAIDVQNYSHEEYFNAIINYFKSTYSKEISNAIDIKCKDVARATFLCYDPTAFIHPKHLLK